MATRRQYSKEFKAAAAGRVDAGEPSRAVAEDIGVSQSMVCRWRRQFRDDVPPALIETLVSEISEPEPEGLIIPDSKNRIMLIPALIESGYSVRMEDGRVYYD